MGDGAYESNIPLNAAAVLVWLPRGVIPSESSFNIGSVEGPPIPNPEPWWECGQAILYAVSLTENNGKVPWIKVGDLLLDPDRIAAVAAKQRSLTTR